MLFVDVRYSPQNNLKCMLQKKRESFDLRGSLWILPPLYVLVNRSCCRFIGLPVFFLPNVNCYSLEEIACAMFVIPKILTHLPLLLRWPRNKNRQKAKAVTYVKIKTQIHRETAVSFVQSQFTSVCELNLNEGRIEEETKGGYSLEK